MVSEHRVDLLRRVLEEKGLDALLVTKPANVRYLTGFTGSAGSVLLAPEGAWLFTDFRYLEQAAAQVPWTQVVSISRDLSQKAGDLLGELRAELVAFESDHVVYDVLQEWRDAWSGVEPVPRKGLVEDLRICKDESELELIQKAVGVADEAFNRVLPLIQPGVSEERIALELIYQMMLLGGEGASFDPIVASGPRGALPHGRASERVIQKCDLVTIDMGTRYRGYASDMTRTVAVGEIDSWQQEVYDLVLEAQLAGVRAVRAGRTGQEVDAVARGIIEEAGYGDRFGHGLGHGVGLDVHERPSLSALAGDDPLRPGMVVTVEPGIYVPGRGGVRIEDMVVVTEDGARIMTGTPKELLVL